MFIHASMFLILFILASCYLECGSWTSSTSTDMQTLSPPPKLQIHNLHLYKILGWLVYTQKHLWNFTNNPWDSHLICQGGVKAMTSTKLLRWFQEHPRMRSTKLSVLGFYHCKNQLYSQGFGGMACYPLVTDHMRNPKLVQKRWGWRVWLLPANSSPLLEN